MNKSFVIFDPERISKFSIQQHKKFSIKSNLKLVNEEIL